MADVTTAKGMMLPNGNTSDRTAQPSGHSALAMAFSSYRNIPPSSAKFSLSPQNCLLSQHDGTLVLQSATSHTVVSYGRLGPITLTSPPQSSPAPPSRPGAALSLREPGRMPAAPAARAKRLRGVIFDRSEAGMAAAERMAAASAAARCLLERWACGRDRFAVCIETDVGPGMIGGSARDFTALMEAVLPNLLDVHPDDDPCKFAFAVARNIHDSLKFAVERRHQPS